MTLSDEVSLVNAKVDAAIRADGLVPDETLTGIFSEILEYDRELVSATLGATGTNIHAFAELVDLEHPDLYRVADGRLQQGSAFCKTAIELLRIAKFAKSHDLAIIPPHFPKIFIRQEDHGFVAMRITDPHKNAFLSARLLKDRDLIKTIRLRKPSIDLGTSALCGANRDEWDDFPHSFAMFVRGETPYRDEIESITRKTTHFQTIGLKSMIEGMLRRVESLKQLSGEPYYGFNRCSIGLAKAILAKSHGFTMQPGPKGSSRLRISNDILKPIKERCFEIVSERGGNYYQPRIYIAGTLPDTPERMVKTIELLDNFPEAKGKPIFDHFCVLMPSLGKTVEDRPGEVSAKIREMDAALIASKAVVPVLLGVREDKSYFIDYFC